MALSAVSIFGSLSDLDGFCQIVSIKEHTTNRIEIFEKAARKAAFFFFCAALDRSIFENLPPPSISRILPSISTLPPGVGVTVSTAQPSVRVVVDCSKSGRIPTVAFQFGTPQLLFPRDRGLNGLVPN